MTDVQKDLIAFLDEMAREALSDAAVVSFSQARELRREAEELEFLRNRMAERATGTGEDQLSFDLKAA